jgi:hypothetical protein
VSVSGAPIASTVGEPWWVTRATDIRTECGMSDCSKLSVQVGRARAAYALSTSNCFSAAGSDGHFERCICMLQRRDVRTALPF